MLFFPATFLSFLSISAVYAGSTSKGGNCSQAQSKLQVGTYQFFSNCDSVTYCAANGTCLLRGCRNDQFPLGYEEDDQSLPPMCPNGKFCPDEMDQCLPLLAVGSLCQLNRDDECEPQPNWQPSASTLPGSSFNGSVCLNYQCLYKNITSGQNCTVENTPYTAYGADNEEFIDIVSRDNCVDGYYCDAQSLTCNQAKVLAASCTADKECASYNCLASGICGNPPWAPEKVGLWVYIVCAVGIVGGIVGTLTLMFMMHRKERDQEREKRNQYWREQSAFRQNIIQMRETAIGSLNSIAGYGGSNRSTMYAASETSQTPMLHPAGKSSRLRNNVSDDGTDDEEIMMRSPSDRRPRDNRI